MHDWHKFFEPLKIHISGLTSTKNDPQACHVWRLIRRTDLNLYGTGVHVDVPEDQVDKSSGGHVSAGP